MKDLSGMTLLDRYVVREMIGRGGMADVYLVWDKVRTVLLAMKLLREDLAEDKVFLRRFRREAQNLARLQHPHIVRSYGLERDGIFSFLLMDYVEGTTLRREIFESDEPFTTERVLEIIRPVCSALHYAHQMGVIHCDAKPANIMIDQGGRVLVTDFGIARMTEAATATMVGAGTPAYMSPEQIKGADPIPQTDIYGLGVVLFEMLTGGERPFTGEQATVTGTTGEKVRWEHLNLRPPSPRRWNADASVEMEAVVARCLEKNPEDRFSGVQELLSGLEAYKIPVELVVQTGEAPPVEQLPPEPAIQEPHEQVEEDLVGVSIGLREKSGEAETGGAIVGDKVVSEAEPESNLVIGDADFGWAHRYQIDPSPISDSRGLIDKMPARLLGLVVVLVLAILCSLVGQCTV